MFPYILIGWIVCGVINVYLLLSEDTRSRYLDAETVGLCFLALLFGPLLLAGIGGVKLREHLPSDWPKIRNPFWDGND